jgi:RES domain-containing protein
MMTLEQDALSGDSSTAVSILPPNGEEKELEDTKDLERSVPESKDEDTGGNEDSRAAVMDWDGPNDPGNPQTWSESKKMYHILVPTLLGFVV